MNLGLSELKGAECKGKSFKLCYLLVSFLCEILKYSGMALAPL